MNRALLYLKSSVIVLSLFAVFYTIYFVDYPGYDLLFLLPLTYLLCFVCSFGKLIGTKNSIFFYVFVTVTFFRYIVLPLAIVKIGYYGGRSSIEPKSSSYQIGILLIAYELIAVTLFLNRKERQFLTSGNKTKYTLSLGFYKNPIYVLFFIFVIVYLIAETSWLSVTNIFVAAPMEGDVITTTIFGAYLFVLLKQIFFVFGVVYTAKVIAPKSKVLSTIIILILVIINVGIFLGTNRSDVLVVAIVSFLVLSKYYGKQFVRTTSIILGIGVFFLLSHIASVRNFASISGNSDPAIDRTDFLQIYLGGPYNVATAIETKEEFPEASSPQVLFFDIFRPMIGVNFLVKDLDIKYSNIYFNRRLFHSDRRSQILPMVGQGNLFFSFILSPIITIFFVFVAYYLLNLTRRNSDLLMYYFFSLSIARMGFLMGQNSMNIINDLSFNIFLFLVVFYLNKKFISRRI